MPLPKKEFLEFLDSGEIPEKEKNLSDLRDQEIQKIGKIIRLYIWPDQYEKLRRITFVKGLSNVQEAVRLAVDEFEF